MVDMTLQQKSLWKTTLSKNITLATQSKFLLDYLHLLNLGIGIPTLFANFLDPGVDIILQSENDILGLDRFPTQDEVDSDLIKAGKESVKI